MAERIYHDQNFQSVARITNLPAATATGHPVTFEQLNAAIEGLAHKDDVRVSTQGNINLASPGSLVDGILMDFTQRVLVRAQTNQTENGIYIWNGPASAMTRSLDANTGAELISAVVPVAEGTDAGRSYRQTAVNITLGSTNLTFVPFGVVSGAASETSAGIAEIATQAETDAGTDDTRIVSPLKLKNWATAKKKSSFVFGNGSTQYDLTHNFNTLDVFVSVRETISGTAARVEWKPLDANTVRITTAVGVAINDLTATILA